MNRAAIIDKMRKVLALANQGVGGEKDNAERQLDSMLRKYNINREELEGETKRRLWLSFQSKDEKTIAMQVIAWAVDTHDIEIWRRGTRREVGADVTEAQRVQIMVAYGVYCREYAKIQKNMMLAFFSRNELFPSQARETKSTLSPEEIRAIQKLMGGMDKTNIHKQVTHDAS